jgi:ACS family hexuronate transporter-like MFS transporter
VELRYRMLTIMTLAQIGASVVQQGYGSLAPAIVGFFHITKAQLGLSMTSMALGSAVTVALGGALVDRLGERNVTMFAGCSLCATLIIGASVPSYAWLVAWLFVVGVAYATLTPAGGRAILIWFERDRGLAMSIRQMGVPIGAVVGGSIMPLVAVHFDYQLALMVGGLFALVMTAGAAFLYRDPDGAEFPSTRFRHLMDGMKTIARDPRTIWFTAGCMLLAGVQQMMNGFISLTATNRVHTTLALAALAFVVAQFAAIVGRATWGRLSDSLFAGDRVLPVVYSCLIVFAAGIGLASTRQGTLALLFACAFALGFAAAGWNGLFSAAMAEIGGPRFAGSAIGIGLTAIFFGSAFGPWCFGAVADRFGLVIAWLFVSAISAVALVPSFLARKAFKHAEMQERASLG